MIRGLSYTGLALVSAGAGYSIYDPAFRAALPTNLDGSLRYARTSFNVLITAADYKLNVLKPYNVDLLSADTNPEEFKKYKQALKDCNIRAAKRLYQVCKSHGGIYNKFAQYVSTMNNVLPKEAIEIIAPLQDKAKQIPKEEAEAAIKAELASIGQDFDSLFIEFDEEAIGAASLAQVHRGVIRYKGKEQEVALKVQYPRLQKQVSGDVSTITFLATVLGKVFPQFEYTWLVPEFEGNLRLELDFQQEGKNAMRMKKMFSDRKDVYVPEVFSDLSTPKLLVMEFVQGWKVDKVETSLQNKISPAKVARTVSTVFGDMIHVHGFVHCDPHAGNLLVRKKEIASPSLKSLVSVATTLSVIPVCVFFGLFNVATLASAIAGCNIIYQRYLSPARVVDFQNNYELVVLDHGMYRRLEPDFRKNYCGLWKALLLQDEELGKRVVQKLGIGLEPEAYEVLSLSLTYRTPKSKFQTGGRMTKEQLRELRERYSQVSMQDLNDFLKQLPRDLLFVMRSTNIVRGLNKALGGTSRERFKILGESAVRGLALSDVSQTSSNSALVQKAIKVFEEDEDNRTLLMDAPYRVNLPVESEIIADRRKPVLEWLEVLKLRTYVEAIDWTMQLISALHSLNGGLDRTVSMEALIDPEVISLDS